MDSIDVPKKEFVKKRAYTVEEIAAILGIGKKAAYNLVREKPFKVVRIGTTIRISKASFDQWFDEIK